MDGAEPAESSEDSIDADLVRVVSRDWEKARRVPSELRAEMARAESTGEQAWVEARKASDFSILLPHLERNVELTRRYADCYDGFEDFSHPYDPLLDEYEPQMGTEAMRSVLGELREGLVPLVSRGDRGTGRRRPATCLHGEFPEIAQRELIAEMVGELPFPEGGWRIDPTDHPFAITIGRGDVRLTTRYDEDNLGMALFSSMHEAGHGLYEAGQDPALARTPLEKPRSLGLHESQSRLWENWVARGRPYLGHLLPKLRERFPDALRRGRASSELHRDANRVERSLIRIEADEVTYNLHILIRFELELEIFDGELELADLPEAWNARYRDYLGLEVPDDARGVLQDVHWSGGAFGYFPTYSLGNVIAGQLWVAADARPAATSTLRSRPASWPRSASGCATGSTATGAGSPPPRSSSGPGAASSQSSRCSTICRRGPRAASGARLAGRAYVVAAVRARHELGVPSLHAAARALAPASPPAQPESWHHLKRRARTTSANP